MTSFDSGQVVEPRTQTIANSLALPCTGDKVYIAEDTAAAIALLDRWPEPVRPFVIGACSNLILPERIVQPCLQLGAQDVVFETIDSQNVRVRADAGLLWDSLVERCVGQGLRGLENLSWIPGTVGAAPVQNIGAYGVELSDVLEEVLVYDFEHASTRCMSLQECHFAYRDSIFKQQAGRFVILTVTLRLSLQRPFNLEYGEIRVLAEQERLSVGMVRDKVIQVRQAKLPDPGRIPNVGSFFKNPVVPLAQAQSLLEHFPGMIQYPLPGDQVKLAAGWLIDQAGWKGTRLARAGVHERQALVLTNLGQATQKDILELAEAIRRSIRERYGIELEIEPTVLD